MKRTSFALTATCLLLAAVFLFPSNPVSAQSPVPDIPGLTCPPVLGGAVLTPQSIQDDNGVVLAGPAAGSHSFNCWYVLENGSVGAYIGIFWSSEPGTCPASGVADNINSDTHYAYGQFDSEEDTSADAPTAAELTAEVKRMLAVIEPLAAPCGGAAPSASGVCEITGVVSDHRSKPVSGVHVQLSGPGLLLDTTTDAAGKYRFADFVTGRSFDPATDKAQVSMFMEQPNRFQFFHKTEPVEQRSVQFDVNTPSECKRDFTTPGSYQTMVPNDASGFKDLWAIYRQLEAAWDFAEQQLLVPLDYLPIRVVTGCDTTVNASCDTTPHAFYRGTHTDSDIVNPPEIVFEINESIGKANRMDDTTYHEFGHHLMAEIFDNAIPASPGRIAHGGYYANASSNDAWVEGFASFYSAMVTKVAEGNGGVPKFRFPDGSSLTLEPNMKIWGGNGKLEEIAVTGVLLDFEDGSSDYSDVNPAVSVITSVRYKELKTKSGHTILVGKIPDVPKGSLALLFIEFVNDAGKRVAVRSIFIDSSAERSGQDAVFWTIAPKDLAYSSIRFGGLKENMLDDDPIDLELTDLFVALESGKYPGPKPGKPERYAHIFDVYELYQVLKAEFGGEDRDGNGTEDVDQIFIEHGVHSDPNSNQTFDPGETVGLSNRKALDAAGRPTGTAAERMNVRPLEEQMATVDTGGVAASFVAFVDFPAPNEGDGYSYEVEADDEDRVTMVVPPEGSGGTVTLMAMADGYLPEVVAEVGEQTFWEDARAHPGESFLSFDVALEPGEVSLDDEKSATGPLIMVLAGGLAALAAGGQLVLNRRRTAGPS